jgi:hypothetical protein
VWNLSTCRCRRFNKFLRLRKLLWRECLRGRRGRVLASWWKLHILRSLIKRKLRNEEDVQFNAGAIPLVVASLILSIWVWRSRQYLATYANRVLHREWSKDQLGQRAKLVIFFPVAAGLISLLALFGDFW